MLFFSSHPLSFRFLRMSQDVENADEQTRLLSHRACGGDSQLGPHESDEHVQLITSSLNVNREDQSPFATHTEERLPYNNFVAVDLLRDLVQWKQPARSTKLIGYR